MNRIPRRQQQDLQAAASPAGLLRWIRLRVLVLPVLVLALYACGEDAGELATDVTAFTNANIYDGTGAAPIQNGVILVRDGRIEAVGPAIEVPQGAEVVDLEGRWVIPGLINAHAHVEDMNDGSANVPEQLEQYAHYGVTTALSLGEEGTDALALRQRSWSTDAPSARVLAAGRIYMPRSAEEGRAAVDTLASQNVDWVKLRVDSFLGTADKIPPEAYQAVIEAAHAHDIPVAIHLVELEDAKAVLRAGADLIGHSVRDQVVDQEFIDLLLERNVCVVPTFTRELSTFVYAERPDFFDDPFFLERAAPQDLEGYRAPLVEGQRSAAAQYYQAALPTAEENMRRLHAAGVPIAFGTDTGTRFRGRFQGYLEHVELQMMVDAGFTPEEALRSATSVTASCIDREGEVGSLVPGAWADFVVLNANPLEDILNTRQIHGVWIGGNQFR